MRRSWVIASGLLFWVGCTTSIKVGDDGPGGSGGTTSSSSGSGGATSSSTSSGSGDPCDGIACTTPPAPECTGASSRRVHEPVGTCAAGVCSYAYTDTVCPNGCSGGACIDGPAPVAIATGGNVTCLVLNGGVQCWGRNYKGALGNNSMTDSHVPVPVVGLASGVTAIAVGDTFACAVTSTGGVECWGRNNYAALGDGSTTDSLVPVAVTGLSSGVVGISAGSTHACAVTVGGGVQCWGDNTAGQLGNNTAPEFLTPVAVAGLPPVVAVSAGLYHTCALTATGGVKCWGGNGSGQLGNNTTVSSYAPVDVVGLSIDVAAIATPGASSCALLKSGAVKCWGYRNALGDDGGSSSSVPVGIVGLSSGVVAIGGGADHMCALLATGGVKCWGDQVYGQVGNNVTNGSLTFPTDVLGLSSGVVAISSGGASDHSCAILATGKIMCWGLNGNGQLGDNSTTLSDVPVEVVGY